MAIHAIRDAGDALSVTRDFLTPVEPRTWLKLALITVFVGGTTANVNPVQFGMGGNGTATPGSVPADLGPRAWLIVAAVVAAVLSLSLAFALVGSILEFVFVESLRSGEVRLRAYWGRRWRQGVRLFGFRLLVGLSVGAVALLLTAPALLAAQGGTPFPDALGVLLLLLLLPVGLVLGLTAGIISSLTTGFVVPIMMVADCGVLDGWRRLWPTITAQPLQYLAFLLVGFGLSVVGGVAAGLVLAVVAVVLLLPFGLLGAVGVGLLLLVQPVGLAALALVAAAFALTLLAVSVLVQVPIQTYLRYYALLVLGDVAPSFDLVPDRRAAVRAGRGD